MCTHAVESVKVSIDVDQSNAVPINLHDCTAAFGNVCDTRRDVMLCSISFLVLQSSARTGW